MRKQIVGMVLAGGRVDELSVLTAKRPKSAVPVWGMYRVIDFVISNMMHSGIDVVGVLSQYRPHSLNSHLAGGAPWDYVGRTRELRILSPYLGADDTDWYKGTADAIYQNLNFLRTFSAGLVLIASGDHVYSMDYRPMIRAHLARGADLTIALKRVPHQQASRFGTAVLDDDGRVTTYEEKAKRPASDLASLTIYVFNAATLIERLRENAAEGKTFQIYSEIIPRMVREGARVFGHVFDGYWQYARTLEDYYATNMDVLGPKPPDLASWQVRTNLTTATSSDPPPALFSPLARVRRSLVAPGTVMAGTVERSVISPGVRVEAGAVVRDAIVMHNCCIESGAVVENAILDKSVHVGKGTRVGRAEPGGVGAGITLVGKFTSLPAGIEVGRGCILAPDLPADRFAPRSLPDGTAVLS